MIIEIALIHLYLEMHTIFSMIFPQSEYLCISLLHYLLQVLFVVFGPFVYGKLFYVDRAVFELIDLNGTFYLVVPVLFAVYLPEVTFVPRVELGEWGIAVQALDYHSGYVSWIVVWDVCAPTRANTLTAVDQTHGNDRHIVLWLYELTIILDVGESMIIRFRIDKPCYLAEVSEDVSGACVIFTSLVSRTELTIGHEKIDVIRTYKILSHVDNGHGERHLAMMIC